MDELDLHHMVEFVHLRRTLRSSPFVKTRPVTLVFDISLTTVSDFFTES